MDPLPDRLPLVIGVTGHRDLRDQDVQTLEREVAVIVERLRHDYLHGDVETPIIVLSSLAEGADRLVARVALAHGARLVAPMPMPIDEYRRDFEPGLKVGNAAEFDALLAQAIAAPVVPFTPGNSLAAVRADASKREEQYRAAGLFIAQHANVLITLWDGDGRAMRPGGTAEVVAFKRRGIPLDILGSARASLDASEIGPVIHVVTPRQRETSAAEAVSVRPWGHAVIRRCLGGWPQRVLDAATAFVANVLGREVAERRERLSEEERWELESWETFEALTAQTRTFNRDAARLSAPGRPDQASASLEALFALPSPSPVDGSAARQITFARAPRWCRMYAIADALAQRWQIQFGRDWFQVYLWALSGISLLWLFFDQCRRVLQREAGALRARASSAYWSWWGAPIRAPPGALPRLSRACRSAAGGDVLADPGHRGPAIATRRSAGARRARPSAPSRMPIRSSSRASLPG